MYKTVTNSSKVGKCQFIFTYVNLRCCYGLRAFLLISTVCSWINRWGKKGSYNSTSLQDKTTMPDDFELWGEDEMEPTSSVTFSMSLRITWSLGHASQSRREFVFYKAHLFYFFKWPIISLDKTLIRRLVLFIALWICTETVILTFNHLESIGANYMDTNPGMFSSKTLIYFRLKKEMHKHIGWHGGE